MLVAHVLKKESALETPSFGGCGHKYELYAIMGSPDNPPHPSTGQWNQKGKRVCGLEFSAPRLEFWVPRGYSPPGPSRQFFFWNEPGHRLERHVFC